MTETYMFVVRDLDSIERELMMHWSFLRAFLKHRSWKLAGRELDEVERLLRGIRNHIRVMREVSE